MSRLLLTLLLAQSNLGSSGQGNISRTAPLQLVDEGARKGSVGELNFTGSGVSCTKSGVRGTCTVPGGGGSSFEGDAGSIVFIGADGQLAERNERLFFDNANGKLGINTRSPLQAIHVDGDGGSLLLRGYGDQRAIWHQRGFVGTGDLAGANPEFSWGSVIAGGVGAPLIRLLYSDDGNLPDAGGTVAAERAIFEVERTGTAGFILDGQLRSVLEGFTRNNDYKPTFRVSRYPDAQLELGAGGMLAVAGNVVRDGGAVLVTTESSYAHKFRVGDRVFQSQSEGNFPLPTTHHLVATIPAYNQFTYTQDGGNIASTTSLYFSAETDTLVRREDSQRLSLYAHGHVFGEAVGTGDAGATSFSDTAARYPVVEGTIVVRQVDGGAVAVDDGSGNVTGTGITGTITYASGALALTYSAAPVGAIVWDYSHNPPRLSTTATTVEVSDWSTLGLPKWPTASLPAAGALTGHVVYDSTAGALKFSNGSTWGAISGGGYATIQDEGTPVTQRTILNFSGPFTLSDDGSKTTVVVDDATSSTAGLLSAGAQTVGGRKQFPGTPITTDASYTVASVDQLPSFTKNDSNTRHFYGSRLKPTFNFGGSNANTTVNILEVSSTNTSVTGLGTVNLANFAFNDESFFELRSTGAFVVHGSAGSSGQYLKSAGSSAPPTWGEVFPTTSFASGSVDDTTTSGTPAVMDDMTLTPGAGDYVVMFSASIENTDGAGVNILSINVNGSAAGVSTRYSQNDAWQSATVAITTKVTGVGAGEAIAVYWSTTAGTATVHYRTLVLIKVG